MNILVYCFTWKEDAMDKTIPGKIMQHVISIIASSFIFTTINPEKRQFQNFDAQYVVCTLYTC